MKTVFGSLVARLESGSASVVVIGLGYVGVPVAVALASAGFSVVGFDLNEDRVRRLAAGRLPVAENEPGLPGLLQEVVASRSLRTTTDASAIRGADAYLVAVDTPITRSRQPDLSRLRAALSTVSAAITHLALVSIESTLPPTAMAAVVKPALAGSPALLVHCPERVRPGRLLRNLHSQLRLIGAEENEAVDAAMALYSKIVRAPLVATTFEAAEVTKTAENAARDVQIALANQLSVICDYSGVDFRFVRDHVNRVWSGESLVLESGAGVGGYCLPKDPWLLTSVLPLDVQTPLISAARTTNDAMPAHVVACVQALLAQRGIALADARVAVFGLTYDADSEDDRNAPGARLLELLSSCVRAVIGHDPLIAELAAIPEGPLDLAVVVIPHSKYCSRDFWVTVRAATGLSLLLDCRRRLPAEDLTDIGVTYAGLGTGLLRADRGPASDANPNP